MSKDLKTLDLNILPLETLAEMTNEANEQVERSAKAAVQKAIDAGRYLMAAKEQIEHGQWGAWFGANIDFSQATASRYVSIASNYSSMNNLKDAKDVNDALRMIADSKPEKDVPRSARKPADVVVTTPNEITETVADDDPTPDPPTNRKTAKGSEKVPEDKKPKTQAIVPEILPDDQVRWPETAEEQIQYVLDRYALQEILNAVVAGTTSENAKRIANLMRKSADKLDPPDETKAKVPTASALRATVDGGTMSEEMMLAIHDWVNHKQNNPDKVYKYKSIESWKKDLKRILSVAQRSGEPFVIEALDKAESKGWRGWEQNEQNGKANGNGRRTTETNDPSSCLGPNGRPRVERAKINYK